MADERHGNNLTAFLLGFVLGAVLAGGAGGAFLFFRHAEMRKEIAYRAAEAQMMADRAAELELQARMFLEHAREKEKAAHEALQKLKGGKKP